MGVVWAEFVTTSTVHTMHVSKKTTVEGIGGGGWRVGGGRGGGEGGAALMKGW